MISTIQAEVGNEVQQWGVYEIEKLEGALILAKRGDQRIIFNTLSPNFIQAELISDAALGHG